MLFLQTVVSTYEIVRFDSGNIFYEIIYSYNSSQIMEDAMPIIHRQINHRKKIKMQIIHQTINSRTFNQFHLRN